MAKKTNKKGKKKNWNDLSLKEKLEISDSILFQDSEEASSNYDDGERSDYV